MRYIRRKENHLMIKAFGFTSAGGLGDFDTQVYEEVEGDLPQGFQMEVLDSLNAQLDDIFMNLPPEIRAVFYQQKAAVKIALESQDVEAAQLIILGTTVPEELESVKQELLSVFSVSE
jgi:hypothetical protein